MTLYSNSGYQAQTYIQHSSLNEQPLLGCVCKSHVVTLFVTYKSIGDYGKAFEYHKKSLKIAIEIGDRNGEGQNYGNLALCCMGRTGEAHRDNRA